MKVFYDSKQTVEQNRSNSPSAGKPKLAIEQWQERKYPIEFGVVEPVTREQFYLVHDRKYIDGVLDCKINNGFENRQKDIADSLCWTTGSMLSAALYSLTTKENSCSPTSGFHHAEYNRGMGYCTFNGLMVASAVLKKNNLLKNRVGIVDIDHHYGNGTDNIITKLGIDYVQHYTFGQDETNYGWNGGEKAKEWLTLLPMILNDFSMCDIIFYQAGGDPHVNDPHGGALTDEQLRERDKIVFTTFKKLNIPVVWNLAGGYQTPIQKVLDIHNATLEECLKVMI